MLFGSYHPPSQSDNYYFDNVTNALDLYCQTYDKFLLIGDFNAEDSEPCLSRFLYEHNSKNLVKDKTCFKSLENPSCIDLFLTNSPLSFQNTVTMSTGLSYCHKMVITVLKSTFAKTKPKEIIYRDYKKFNADFFKSDLKVALSNEGDVIHRYALFEKIFLQVLDKHAPLRKKLLRANHAPYITKSVRKAIMRRSQLESKFLKHKTPESRQIYTKQRNYCSRLYKKERKKYYNNLNINKITDNKQFWQTVKPLLSEKGTRFAHINLVDNEKIISEDRDVAQTLNNFFENAVKSLGIKENQYIFTFSSITVEEILSEISSLDSKKAGTFKNIPTKHLKETSDICSEYLLNVWNNEIVLNHCFPDNLKLADITPIFKKDDATLAKNYRPVSVLPCASKRFERIIQKQLMSYVDKHLSPYLCGYRRGFSAQYALVSLIEKWKESLDKKGFAGAVLMDLSKAFDTINHELLIAK